MLRGMTVEQFFEWEQFAELEPFDERREDWRIASIVTMLANLMGRDPDKTPKPFTLEDFVLNFGDQVMHRKLQTWQDQISLMDQYYKAGDL